MRTAVDTNVMSKMLHGLAMHREAAELMAAAQGSGSLVVCPVVYAELLASPMLEKREVHVFLQGHGIAVDRYLGLEVWEEAGLRFRRFSARRKRSGGDEPRRLLADFVIGAHALLHAERLLTFDVDRYRLDFPELRLVKTS